MSSHHVLLPLLVANKTEVGEWAVVDQWDIEEVAEEGMKEHHMGNHIVMDIPLGIAVHRSLVHLMVSQVAFQEAGMAVYTQEGTCMG
jgi:hypothetical protein